MPENKRKLISMNQIDSQLWISDIVEVRTGPTEQFDRVITVCQENVIDNVGCSYEWYNMSDGPENSYGGDSSYSLFQQAATSLLSALRNGEAVLIHCHMGQSRSVSVAIAAYAVWKELDYEEARAEVMDKNGRSHPERQLVRYTKRFIEDHSSQVPKEL